MGMHLMQFWNSRLWFDAFVPSSVPVDNANVLSIDVVQGVADVMCAQAAGGADPREVEFYVDWMQRLQDLHE